MADFYASSLAVGGGTGTQLSPFTLAEMIAYINASFNPGDIAWIKADGIYASPAYTITKAGSTAALCVMEGYTSTIGDGGIATIQRSSGTLIFVTQTQNYWRFSNIIWDANSLGSACVSSGANQIYTNCGFAKAGSANGISGGSVFINCAAYNNATLGFSLGSLHNCIAYLNGTIGINAPAAVHSCISCNNGTYGISIAGGSVQNSVIYANGAGGISVTAMPVIISNCAITNHVSGYGINFATANVPYIYNCNFYANSGLGDTNIPSALINKKTVDPQYVNPIIYDFRRTGTNMDGIGFSDVGMKGFDYYLSIGVAPNPTIYYQTPIFAGITALVSASEGCLLATWNAGTYVDRYKIYIQASTATGLFNSANEVMCVPSSQLSAKIKTIAGGLVLLDYNTTYYVGVRAANYANNDGNNVSLSAIPNNNVNVTISNVQTSVNAIPTNPLLTTDSRLTTMQTSLDLITNIEGGKWEIINNQMIFYKPDNATEIMRFNLFDLLNNPTMDSPYKRVRV